MATPVDSSVESSIINPVLPHREEGITSVLSSLEVYISGLSKSFPGDSRLAQYSLHLKQLRQKIKDASSDQQNLAAWIQMYAKLLLDVTYVEECRLVEDEFPEPDGDQKLHKLIETIGEPEQLVHRCFGSDTQVSQILGAEISECLHWRRGALFYMYCCTVMERTEDCIKQKQEHLLQCMREGVVFLQAMLRVRAPLELAQSEVSCNSEDTYQLLQAGLFSDTHVLALMYGGELCGWFVQLKQDDKGDEFPNFNAKQTGRALLTAYERAVKGPLKSHGWDVRKARELLEKLGS